MPSSLRFSDATIKTPEEFVKHGISLGERRKIDAQVRPGLSLDRRRGVAYPERLFFLETSVPNGGFIMSASVEGELRDNKLRALLLAGVRSLSFVGGGKSRGLGWVKVIRCILDGKEVKWQEVFKVLQNEEIKG